MKKRIKISMIVFGIVAGLAVGIIGVLRFIALERYDSYPTLASLSHFVFNWNNIDVKVSNDIDPGELRIINVNSGKVVFHNSEYSGGIENKYGWCLFEVYYEGLLLYLIGHDKRNNWHTNEYTFIFKERNGKIDATLKMYGPDENRGELFYKRYDRNQDGSVKKIVYMNSDKKVYNEEFVD
jgi:hypothetical protein